MKWKCFFILCFLSQKVIDREVKERIRIIADASQINYTFENVEIFFFHVLFQHSLIRFYHLFFNSIGFLYYVSYWHNWIFLLTSKELFIRRYLISPRAVSNVKRTKWNVDIVRFYKRGVKCTKKHKNKNKVGIRIKTNSSMHKMLCLQQKKFVSFGYKTAV